MGHGLKCEGKNAQLIYVTTGYLVKYIASSLSLMKNYTHLIIDEVHERSIAGDIILMFAKRLQFCEETAHIKIILMSATAHTALYHWYFTAPGGGSCDEDKCILLARCR